VDVKCLKKKNICCCLLLRNIRHLRKFLNETVTENRTLQNERAKEGSEKRKLQNGKSPGRKKRRGV
jgi:hypothetical protein